MRTSMGRENSEDPSLTQSGNEWREVQVRINQACDEKELIVWKFARGKAHVRAKPGNEWREGGENCRFDCVIYNAVANAVAKSVQKPTSK
jgi:hypothetical protein